MDFVRTLLLLVTLFGLFLLVAGLFSLANAGEVTVPGFGMKMGGTFLIIVALIITIGGFVGFTRMKRR